MRQSHRGQEHVSRQRAKKWSQYPRFRENESAQPRDDPGLGYDVDPGMSLGRLSTAHQQIVEIAKALSYDSRIIIMDEPTSSLTEKEITMLFELIQKLKAKGVSIIYISHRLEEIHQMGDRITVLRDGALIGTLDKSEYSDEKAIRMIAGRTLKQMYMNTHTPGTEVVLELKNFRIGPKTQPFSLSVRAGEVVGLCGLVGSGRTELAKSIFRKGLRVGGNLLSRKADDEP